MYSVNSCTCAPLAKLLVCSAVTCSTLTEDNVSFSQGMRKPVALLCRRVCYHTCTLFWYRHTTYYTILLNPEQQGFP